MLLSHHLLSAASVPSLLDAVRALPGKMPGSRFVFKRFFLSHPRQRDLFPKEPGAVAYIVQPPLQPGVAVAAWVVLATDADVHGENDCSIVTDGALQWIWTSGVTAPGASSEVQTDGILARYEAFLAGRGLNLPENCVRTWFFCHDIDHLYAGLVKARRERFERLGLTAQTHYIASTGIQGDPPVQDAVVQMDALALQGPFSQRYLYAPTHLNPTHEYGVTFERGVRVEAGGSAYTLISGTASIDNKGAVLHVGDIAAQTRRMMENVDVLLSESGACDCDLQQILVYLRRSDDYALVDTLFAERYPHTPYLILHAPVCRPDWLIEMECIAQQPLR